MHWDMIDEDGCRFYGEGMESYMDAWAIVRPETGKSHGPVKKARLLFYHQYEGVLKDHIMVHHVSESAAEGKPLSAYLEHWAAESAQLGESSPRCVV